MFLFGRKFLAIGLLALLPVAPGHAASTNPWAIPGQNNSGAASGSGQGGFSFGGGFGGGFGGNNANNQNFPPVQNQKPLQAPAQVPAAPRPAPVQPTPAPPQFGIYAPLNRNNTVSVPTPRAPQQNLNTARPAPRFAQPYYYPQGYGYGYGYGRQVPYGNNFGGSPFGFGGMPFLNGGFGFNGNFGFGGFPNFVAPGPAMPGFNNPYYGGYGRQLYRPPVRR